MKDYININHDDDVSLVTIIIDIYEEKMRGKTVKVVVSRIGCKSLNANNLLLKKLKEQYEFQKEYKRFDTKFIFFDDFEPGDKYETFRHYFYHYEFKYSSGSFRVDYKILGDK